MEKSLFILLLERHLDGSATPSEKLVLEEYYKKLEEKGLTELTPLEEEQLRAAIYSAIGHHSNLSESLPGVSRLKLPVQIASQQDEVPVRTLLPRRGWRRVWMPASAAAILVAIAGYFYFINKESFKNSEVVAADLPPGRDAAILTLQDGKKVLLD